MCGLALASLFFLFPQKAYAENPDAQKPCTGDTDCENNERCLESICTTTEQINERVEELSAPQNPNAQKDKKSAGVQGIADLDPIKTTPQKFIGRMLKGALGIVGTIALVMIIYAGIKWMLAGVRGGAKEVQQAQDTILWAVIGLAVIFSSYAIVQFIINNVTP